MTINIHEFCRMHSSWGRVHHPDRAARALVVFVLLIAAAFANPPMATAQVNVTMQQNDIGRTGQNLNETILTPSNVSSGQFGLLFSQPVLGQIYAQPLYLSGISINGATHNVVYVATLNGYVYAFDAYSNTGANAGALWSISLLDTAHGAAPGATTYGTVGTFGTPAIDPAGGTLYVVSTSYESGAPIFRLHALDVTSGEEKFGGPVPITPSVPGTAADAIGTMVPLTTRNHLQRTGLLLLNGVVYVGFGAAYSEGQESVWHGWVVGYDAATLAETGAFCSTPNGKGGGYWMSGEGLAADQLDPVNYPFGRMFIASGNGDFTATAPYSNNMDYGDSITDLDLTNGIPTVTDDFTPYNQASLYSGDLDQGSGGVLILPTQTSGSYPHLLVQAGKTGTLFLANRDSLGGYNTTTNQVVQSLPGAVGNTGVWSSPAYWNGNVYYWGTYDHLKSFALVNGLLSTTPTESQEVSEMPGATPAISASGSTLGIVWTIDSDAYATGGAAILEAHDASNVATTLYSSATNAARDTAGPAAKFAIPTVANGQVYVGTANQLDVYGLISASQTATPTFSPASSTFAGTLSVTIADSTPGAAIYYTTDGTPASTASTAYTGPVTVTSSQMINAVAIAPGAALSNQAWANYSNIVTATPVFQTPALAYPGPQSVVITDASAKSVIYYTTDGSTPTTASNVYTGPITVNTTETIRAVAKAPGRALSPIVSATYTIAASTAFAVSDQSGFASSAGLSLLGVATVSSNALQLTGGKGTGASAAWFATPVNVQAFITDFYFQVTKPFADGFTFTMQDSPAGGAAVGAGSGGLGYQGITSSVAVKFDIYDNAGEGTDSTGFYLNGASPTVPALDMTTSGVNLQGGHVLHANLTYDGTTLTLTLTDTVTGASYTNSSAINIPAVVGANTAYVGFTAGIHGAGAVQTIQNWTYVATANAQPGVPTPTFAPAAGTYSSAQSVTISDTASGATIYYSTNGSVPTTSSATYTAPISVGTNETVSAIAVVSGASSGVGSAAYQIAAAVPTFSPPAGTYSGTQSVTISDATSGATIYYTTNGTAPSTSSAVYSAPVTVAADETLMAIAASSANSPSAAGSAVYKIRTPTPTFSPGAGTYSSAQSVTISDSVPGATIYYTTDGSKPTTASAVYSGPITVSASETVKALAVASGYASSLVGSAKYTIN